MQSNLDSPYEIGGCNRPTIVPTAALTARPIPTTTMTMNNTYTLDDLYTGPITSTNMLLSARLLEQTSMAIDLAENQQPLVISNRSSRKDNDNFNIQTSSYPMTQKVSQDENPYDQPVKQTKFETSNKNSAISQNIFGFRTPRVV